MHIWNRISNLWIILELFAFVQFMPEFNKTHPPPIKFLTTVINSHTFRNTSYQIPWKSVDQVQRFLEGEWRFSPPPLGEGKFSFLKSIPTWLGTPHTKFHENRLIRSKDPPGRGGTLNFWQRRAISTWLGTTHAKSHQNRLIRYKGPPLPVPPPGGVWGGKF